MAGEEQEEEAVANGTAEEVQPPPAPFAGVDREPPPTWDGKSPETTYKTYKKDLRIWSGTTDIPGRKQAGRVLRKLSGDARLACEDLTEDEILDDDGVSLILEKLDEYFGPYLEQTMPRAFEQAVYGGLRTRGQTLLAYTAASQTRFTQLKREGVDLPPEARGYIITARRS